MFILFLAFIPLVGAVPISQSAAKYSDEFARAKILPMCAATDNKNPIECLKNHFAQPEVKKRYDVACDKYLVDRCVGYAAVDHTDKAILMAFRGTSGTAQYFLESEEAIFANRTHWVAGGLVSKYFAQAFMAIWNGGMKDDFLSLKNQYPDYALWIAGHSLGGSMATLAASYIVALDLFDATNLRLVTFGQPRTGDVDFAAAHDKQVPYTFRIVHAKDIVPHLPMQYLEHYHHHITEVFYNNNMTTSDTYVECKDEESVRCSDGRLATSFSDHSYYFNVPVWEWGAAGCPPV